MMALQFVAKTCTECGKVFQTSNGSAKCFGCTLEDLCHGLPPEEGDFNTAAIRSGTLSEQERIDFQRDLEAIECGGRTTDEEWESVYYEADDDDCFHTREFNAWYADRCGGDS